MVAMSDGTDAGTAVAEAPEVAAEAAGAAEAMPAAETPEPIAEPAASIETTPVAQDLNDPEPEEAPPSNDPPPAPVPPPIAETKSQPSISHISIAQQPSIKQYFSQALEKIQFNKRKKLDKIVELAKKRGKIVNDDAQKEVRVSHVTAARYLRELVRNGRLLEKGPHHQPWYEPAVSNGAV